MKPTPKMLEMLAAQGVVKPKRVNKWAPFKSREESLYATRLVIEGSVYRYEALTFKIGDDCRYCPDFVLWSDPFGAMTFDNEWLPPVECHEVKGPKRSDRDRALVKLKVAATMYPWARFFLARYDRGNWSVEEVRRA